MIKFDDFDPESDAVALDEKLQVVVRDMIASEGAMRQTCIQLTGHEKTCQMRADEAQLKCILKSMLFFSRLAQNEMGTDINIHNKHAGNSGVSYLPRRARLRQLLTIWPVPPEISIETFLPLRVLLGNPLIERNCARLMRDESENRNRNNERRVLG
jgi:hypothetical protein